MMYTMSDTPAVLARIERDMARVVELVRAADPHVRSLVLTGGFARGEGAILGGAPQNDYDFVAVRGWGRARRPYAEVRHQLEGELGLHIDLATAPAWRLGHVAPSIFWYETALRGHVVWGEDLLGRIPIRSPSQLDRAEGLRLLVNRAAGLLLITESTEPHEHRIQAAKALLAALDSFLLTRGVFPPTHTERRQAFDAQHRDGHVPPHVSQMRQWFDWAYQFKVDPAHAPIRDHRIAWQTAAQAVLEAVPAALRHAGIPNLEAYARRDGLVDHLVYLSRATQVPGARRLVTNPTSRVRVATLRLLEASLDGTVRPDAAHDSLGSMARATQEPLRLLDSLRHATRQ